MTDAMQEVNIIPTSNLYSMQVRSPSEHQLNGKNMDVELQYYYTAIDGSGAKSVFSVFYDMADGGDVESPMLVEIDK